MSIRNTWLLLLLSYIVPMDRKEKIYREYGKVMDLIHEEAKKEWLPFFWFCYIRGWDKIDDPKAQFNAKMNQITYYDEALLKWNIDALLRGE